MGYNRQNPCPPTSEFRVGDRVVVTAKPLNRHDLSYPPVGATGTVAAISIHKGNPVISMDAPFPGAIQCTSLPDCPWCITFQNGVGIEQIAALNISVDVRDLI